MNRYTIELNEEQLGTIVEALDTYGRICCLQFDESWLGIRINGVAKEYGLDEHDCAELRDDLTKLTRQYTRGRGASWCASPFVKQMYHIQKSISPVMCDDLKAENPSHTCTRCDGPMLTAEQGKIVVTKLPRKRVPEEILEGVSNIIHRQLDEVKMYLGDAYINVVCENLTPPEG